MDTKIYAINEINLADCMEYIKEAGRIIREGGLVAFPTETVYGLGGNALDSNASKKIYEAKGRPSDNPLIAHIADMDDLQLLVKEVPEIAKKIAERFWPGPLTMILKKSDKVPYTTTGGLDTVAIRMPEHPVARKLIREAGVPIAAPSANVSGRPSPTIAKHVIEDLNGKIDIIIDGGQVNIGLESTILDLSGNVPTILRPGYINRQMLEEVIGEVGMDPALNASPDTHIRPKAPGMMYRHYAPKGELTIVDGDSENVIKYINEQIAVCGYDKVGVITTTDNMDRYKCAEVVSLGDRADEDAIAREMYGALRTMDECGISNIFVESFGGGKLGEAIMNRLNKAAGHRIVYV